MDSHNEERHETSLTKADRKGIQGRQDTIVANRALVTQIVVMGADGLRKMANGERASLHDTAAVKEATARYLEECAKAGVMPGMAGLSAELGYSRQNVYHYIKKHPESDTTKWLKAVSDYFGEMMMTGALSGAVSAIPAIFTAKSRFGWREDEEPIFKDTTMPEPTPEEIAEKWADLPE